MKKSRTESVAPSTKSAEPQTPGKSAKSNDSLSWQSRWDDYWFAPQSNAQLRLVHRLVCVVAAIWFLCHLNAQSFWWDSQGLSAAEFTGRLEGFTKGEALAKFRWTPLWLTNSSVVVGGWCLIGVCLSVLGFFNLGGRIARGTLALCVLLLSQRQAWASGLVEPYLVASTGYLAIAKFSTGIDWSHRFAGRLIQVHTWLLLCASLASQLMFNTWWQGEAVWWLPASGHSTWLNTNWFEDRLMLVNLLTHGITVCTVVAIACLWPWPSGSQHTRLRCGLCAGWIVAIAYAFIADQILYGCLLACGTLAWRER